MNDRMFKALANHERHLAEYVQSRNRSSGNGSSGGGASSQPPQQGQMYQGIMPHGMNGGGVAVADVDDYAKPLVIDQPMQFPALDAPLDLIEKASDVEPIPFEELHLSASSSSSAMYQQQQQQQGSVVANALLNEAMNQHNGNVNLGNSCGSDYCHPTYGAASNGAAPRYTYGNSVSNNNGSGSGNNHGGQSNNGNTMDPRNSVSALSIDWETFEMLEQTVDSMDHAAAAAAAAQQQLQYHSQNSQQLLQPHHDALQGGFHPISQTANGGTVQLQGGLAYQV
jgi:hypothetical protein